MANIAVTKYCNLNCSYCFAGTMLEERETKNIDLNQFKRILYWINTDPTERIGIIGGEPTLHPEFSKILFILKHFCSLNNKKSIIFTNGVYLEKYIEEIPDKTQVLININSPNAMSKDQYNKMLNTLQKLYSLKKFESPRPQYSIGCNVCKDIEDYTFFWNIVKQFNIHQVRTSVVAPTTKIEKQDKELYYNQMKPIFLNYVKKAIELDVGIGLDCNQIPECMFTDKEMLLVNQVCDFEERPTKCEPVVDITADFKACSCFGTYDQLVDCKDFENIEELKYYLLCKVNYEKALSNNKNILCKECGNHKLLKCQGGCLAFSQK